MVLVLFVLGTAIAEDTKQEMPAGVENQYQAFIRHANRTFKIKKTVDSLKVKVIRGNVSGKEMLIFVGSIRLYNTRVNAYNFYSGGFGEENWSLFEGRSDMPPRAFLFLDEKGEPVLDNPNPLVPGIGIKKSQII